MPQGWGILPQIWSLPVGMSAIYWFFPEQYPRMSRPPPPPPSRGFNTLVHYNRLNSFYLPFNYFKAVVKWRCCDSRVPANITVLARYRPYTGLYHLYRIQFNRIGPVPVLYRLVPAIWRYKPIQKRYCFAVWSRYKYTAQSHNALHQQKQLYWMFCHMLTVKIHFSLSSSPTGQQSVVVSLLECSFITCHITVIIPVRVRL